MAKASRAFVCQACGAVTSRWSGKCASCGEWNSIIEETAPSGSPALVAIRGGKGRLANFETLAAGSLEAPRLPTGLAELDRVLGGGLVPGSAVLVGGAPGIGKSTLTSAALGNRAGAGWHVLYVSGEESAAQVRLRAERLGPRALGVPIVAETDLDSVVATIEAERPDACVIDSVQVLYDPALTGSAGSVGQVLVSRGSTYGSSSAGWPPSTARALESSASNSRPSRIARLESQSRTRNTMTPASVP